MIKETHNYIIKKTSVKVQEKNELIHNGGERSVPLI